MKLKPPSKLAKFRRKYFRSPIARIYIALFATSLALFVAVCVNESQRETFPHVIRIERDAAPLAEIATPYVAREEENEAKQRKQNLIEFAGRRGIQFK